jgi:hypothetical protein
LGQYDNYYKKRSWLDKGRIEKEAQIKKEKKRHEKETEKEHDKAMSVRIEKKENQAR